MKIIDVTAAIIEKDGKLLIAKRAKGRHMENKWEFPGGKIEDGESPEECLRRELQEELGITTAIKNFIAESVFDYGDKTIRLLGYKAEYISGDFKLTAHDEIKWVSVEKLNEFDFAEADIPLIKKISILYANSR